MSLDVRPDTDEQLLAALRALPPLPKPHYSWPFDSGLLERPELLAEVLRICGAGSITAEIDSYSQPERWDENLRKILAAAGGQRIDLVLKLSPFAGASPDPRKYADTPDGLREIARCRGNLEAVAGLVADSATVAAVWIDQEAFKTGVDDHALAWCNDEVLRAVGSVFPRALPIQHGRGSTAYYGPYDMRVGGHTVQLYNLNDWQGTQDKLLAAASAATAAGASALYPVLSFGGRYFSRFHQGAGWWPDAWATNNAWRLGSYLNDPYFAAKWGPWVNGCIHKVLLWPEVRPAATSTPGGPRPVPAYGAHFVAYCCGANRIQAGWIPEAVE